jgi:5-methylcytosine-specific restriction endonuclease McrA
LTKDEILGLIPAVDRAHKVKPMIDLHGEISEEAIKREKEKARQMRKSAWWMRKVQQGECHYCRQKVGKSNLTMDHVLPLSRGGKSKKGNIVPACKECNNKKKYLLPVEWKEYVEGLAKGAGHRA